MFRAQANPMDDAIVKATDENLVNENWEYILDVCDRVSASPSGPQQAVAALIKRLAHRNANVQIYTLELANALSQNCGPPLHRELASRAFTEALLRLAGDRNTHAQVKQKVMERMETWTEEFGKSPDFGIMGEAYRRLRTSQPSLQPPSKPGKREISSEDRKKEEDELQMALALSVQDSSTATKTNGTVREDSDLPAQSASGAGQAQGTTAATVSRVRALYDFTPSEAGELAFRKGDIIAVLASVYKDWWKGSLRGQTGIFPLNYVEKLQDPTKDELERDAQMEAEVFGEIKNVERLLALLSVNTEYNAGRRGEREEEEISELYQRTLSIRPKLIELIGKYSQKKDDFTQLNEKFIKARRDYEALLESSMAQPQYQYNNRFRYPQQAQPQYGQPPYAQQPPAQYAPPPQQYAGHAPPQQQQDPAQYAPPQQYAGQTVPPQQQPQDPAQRFYSPAPQGEQPSQPAGYMGFAQQQSGAPAAFHFIPGGVAPPGTDPNLAIRRKASPQSIPQQQQQPPSAVPSEMGAPSGVYAQGQGNAFQAPMRQNPVHTLNSGAPQELATGGYESPVDNRTSYASPAPQQQQARQSYDSYTQPQPVQQSAIPTYQQLPAPVHQSAVPAPLHPQPPRSDISSVQGRQRTQSFESSYSGPQSMAADLESAPPQQLQMQPPGLAGGLPPQGNAYQQYQAYHPRPQVTSAPAGDDPGDYYR